MQIAGPLPAASWVKGAGVALPGSGEQSGLERLLGVHRLSSGTDL